MRLTERRENGGKRKWRQIRQENFKGEIRKKKKPQKKRNIAGSVKQGKPSAFGSKEQRKRKSPLKFAKAPFWHKHKKKWALRHKSETIIARSGVTQSPFLSLCGQSAHGRSNLFGRWCADGQNRFYGKTCIRRKKLGRFISKSPVLLLLLHTKSSLKVTQRAEG